MLCETDNRETDNRETDKLVYLVLRGGGGETDKRVSQLYWSRFHALFEQRGETDKSSKREGVGIPIFDNT